MMEGASVGWAGLVPSSAAPKGVPSALFWAQQPHTRPYRPNPVYPSALHSPKTGTHVQFLSALVPVAQAAVAGWGKGESWWGHKLPPPPPPHGLGVCIWMPLVNGAGNSPVSGTADPRSSQTGQVIRGLR